MSEKIIDKNYGSIPHFSTSKLTQQADKKIGIGQEKILTEKARDWKDTIIITEKIDGSNVGVIKKDGQLIALSRAGYSVESSPYDQLKFFGKYVLNNKTMFSFLPEGWRVAGEWCIMAHGTIYDITDESPFLAFDIIDNKNKRIIFIDFIKLCAKHNIPHVPILHIGQPVSLKNSIKLLGSGIYGKPEQPEGFVCRVERESRVDFLCKWVRHDKEDGKFLKDETWNTGSEPWRASQS